MAYLSSIYCTPEDILIRAPGDFSVLVPDGQTLADGSDGVFDGSDRWTLTSAAVDFEASGVIAGDVCELKYTANKTVFGPEGELFAVESAAGNDLTLRRRGRLAGVGKPPGPAAGISGVSFRLPDLHAQIEEATESINALYGIDEDVPDSAPAMLYRVRELRQVTVLRTLTLLYGGRSRGVDDNFDRRNRAIKAEWTELLASTAIHWKSADRPEVSNRFGRIVRG